jgi:hypothetical protein
MDIEYENKEAVMEIKRVHKNNKKIKKRKKLKYEKKDES